MSRIWLEFVKARPKLTPKPASELILASLILLLNIFVVSTINFTYLYTDEGMSHNYVFASLDSETNPLASTTQANLNTGTGSIEYNARYLCGTIVGQDGPLRPGRYNSDINIFNRQQYPISFLWNAVPSSTLKSSNETSGFSNDSKPFTADASYRLQTLAPGGSIILSCKDLVPSFPLYSNTSGGKDRYIEGVSTISVDLDPSIQAALSSSSTGEVVAQPSNEGTNEPNTNILSVDAIYTVNALEVPSREIVLQLVEYTINKEDTSGKLPADIISKPLSITVPVKTNKTVNPDTQVRDILAREYSLNLTERQSLDITIRNLSLGVGALDDNHAISLQRINAYQPAPTSNSNSSSP